ADRNSQRKTQEGTGLLHEETEETELRKGQDKAENGNGGAGTVGLTLKDSGPGSRGKIHGPRHKGAPHPPLMDTESTEGNGANGEDETDYENSDALEPGVSAAGKFKASTPPDKTVADNWWRQGPGTG